MLILSASGASGLKVPVDVSPKTCVVPTGTEAILSVGQFLMAATSGQAA